MLEMENKVLRFLARMGARGSLGQAVYDYLQDGREAFVVSADLAHASGFDRIKEKFPERLINVGIAEQNLIGVASGLAKTGIPVVATSWAMFTSARAADQVRNFMGYMQSNVKLIGMDSGFVQSGFSYSHTNPPDIAIMRAIPGIKIISPCDGIEIYKTVYEALDTQGPIYIRLTGGSMLPIIHKDVSFHYGIGKAVILKEGDDAALIGCGNAVDNLITTSEILEREDISAKVIDMHTVKPLDIEILDGLSDYRLIVTAENHLKQSGLGGAVAEYYAGKYKRPQQLIFGVDDFYPKTGSAKYVEEVVGLNPEYMARQIVKTLNH